MCDTIYQILVLTDFIGLIPMAQTLNKHFVYLSLIFIVCTLLQSLLSSLTQTVISY